MKNYYPAVATKVPPGKTRSECERLLMRFLSNLAWVEEKGFLVDGIGGGSVPAPMGREKTSGFVICEEFDLSYFPEPTEEKALLAMALMREGRGLNHPGYAFLSFYRVLEVAFPNGKERGEWISSRVEAISDHRGKEALAKLRGDGIADVGAHLRDSGRRAIAHAKEEPIIDPDDPLDSRRLWSELPIMTALAQIAIEEVFGVETTHTVWKKHLYELAGFKAILGNDISEQLFRGEKITDRKNINIPLINIELRGRDPYPPLSNLVTNKIEQDHNSLYLRFESQDGIVAIRFELNFAEERLLFNILSDLIFSDTGSSEDAENIVELKRFSKEYFSNGQLQIINTETRAIISRKDAFIPVNMFLDSKTADAEIAHWRQLAVERREWSQRYAGEMARLSTPYLIRMRVTFSDL
jgi:hypothetical protein